MAACSDQEIASTLANLRPLLELGVRVFPGWRAAPGGGGCTCHRPHCESPGKHPRVSWRKEASADEAQVRRWLEQLGSCNWSAVTGEKLVNDKYLVVVDIDPRNGGDKHFDEYVRRAKNVYPDTVEVRSGGGGTHYYLFADELLKKGVLCEGVDFLAAGGSVILPGSAHRSGTTYEWVTPPSTLAIQPLEPWLIPPLKEEKSPAVAGDAIVAEGGRNNHLFERLSQLASRGLSEHELFAVGQDRNVRTCSPPLPETTVRDIARRLAKGERDFSPDLLADLLKEADSPTEWVMERFDIAHGRPTLLSGVAGSCKTWLAQELAIAVATKRDTAWGGIPIGRHGSVLHLDYELGRDEIRARYRTMLAGLAADATAPISVAAHSEIKLDARGAEGAVTRQMKGRVLLIVDSFLASSPSLEENDSSSRRVLDMLGRASAATGCAVLVIVHEGKVTAGSTARRPRGSSALVDAAGSVLSVEPGTTLTIHQVKESRRRRAESHTLMLSSAGTDGLTFLPATRTTPANAPHDVAERIVQYVARNPRQPMSRVARELGGDEKTVRGWLAKLIADGRLCWEPGPHQAKLISVAVAAATPAPLVPAAELRSPHQRRSSLRASRSPTRRGDMGGHDGPRATGWCALVEPEPGLARAEISSLAECQPGRPRGGPGYRAGTGWGVGASL